SGQSGRMAIKDPRVVQTVNELLRRPDSSPELLAWQDEETGEWIDVKSRHVNDHIRTLSKSDLTAKDFRTWHATVLMADLLARRIGDGERVSFRRIVSQ